MLAVIQQTENGVTARFERRFKHPVAKVWSMLTENDRLAQWFPELRVDDLREGGVIKFDMQDGTFETMNILELKPHSVLAYTWGADRVRFELYPEADGCRLVLIEAIGTVTEHTPKDLAGWHVCLDVIGALLDNDTKTSEWRHDEWKELYPQYIRLVGDFQTAN
jgi:uncharacterized protein YndB with AHSA1/START domain